MFNNTIEDKSKNNTENVNICENRNSNCNNDLVINNMVNNISNVCINCNVVGISTFNNNKELNKTISNKIEIYQSKKIKNENLVRDRNIDSSTNQDFKSSSCLQNLENQIALSSFEDAESHKNQAFTGANRINENENANSESEQRNIIAMKKIDLVHISFKKFVINGEQENNITENVDNKTLINETRNKTNFRYKNILSVNKNKINKSNKTCNDDNLSESDIGLDFNINSERNILSNLNEDEKASANYNNNSISHSNSK